MPRLYGNSVNDGGYIYIDYTYNSDDAASDSSSIGWVLGFHFGNGTFRLDNASCSISATGGVGGSSSGGPISVPYGGDGMALNTDIGLTSGTVTAYHAADGTGTAYFSASVSGSGYNGGGSWSSGFSNVGVALNTIPRYPGAPTGLAASGYNDSTPTTVSFSWTAPSNVGAGLSQYELQVSTDSAFGSTVIDNTAAWGTSYNASGLSYSTTYYARVRASSSAGWGAWSSTISFATDSGLPGAPGAPSASGYNDSDPTTATISWTAPSATGTGLTQRQIQMCLDNTFTTNVLDNTGAWGTSVGVTTMAKNTTYYVRVRASSAQGFGPWSATSSFTTGTTLPAAPAAPATSGVTYTGMTVTWAAPSDNGGSAITSYTLQYATNSAFTTGVQTVTGLTGLSYNMTGLTPGQTYYIHVSATTAVGTGAYSATTSQATTAATAPAAPGQPTFTNVGGTSLTASWTAPGGGGTWNTFSNGAQITSYTVEYSTTSGFTTFSTISGITSLSTQVTGLAYGQMYYFRIKAVSSAGTSAPSTTGTVTMGTTTPDAPGSAPSIGTITQTTAVATYTAPAGNGGSPITGYDIEQALDSGFTQSVVIAQDDASPYTLTNLSTATTYYVRYRAKNIDGPGGWSPAVSFQTLAPAYQWNGTTWVPCQLLVWNGTTWVQATSSSWSGSAWV